MAETEPQGSTAPQPAASTPNKKAGSAAALTTLAAICGLTLAQASGVFQEVDQHESGGKERLSSFRDSVGIWTICGGIIRWPDGTPVKQGDTATPDQCNAITIQQINERAKPLAACLPEVRGHYHLIRPLIDLSFNVGVPGICNGTVGRDIRAGNWFGASAAILPWDRGTFDQPQPGPRRDCLRKSDGRWSCRIPGLTARRQDNKREFDVGVGALTAPQAAPVPPAAVPPPVAAPIAPAPAQPPTPAPKPTPQPAPVKRGFFAWLRGLL